ncbi:hypothetical protein CBR_g3202 [Chara braunii]|uniref:Myb-like domain-containing protein n=1 Tax=Chara braunii TaxID=69332 RepID=A0A388KF54_CHABU|nr:hypothetical protein CBR_g3202 [Chara braunii]|eukprot:GBG68661.1 hypothetical protein CBR_g3202 [Chara braunii]
MTLVAHGGVGRPQWMQSPSPLSGGCCEPRRASECGPMDEDFASGGVERDGRRVWKEHRLEMHPQQEESITQGVQRLRVGERAFEADGPVVGGDEYEDDDEGECDTQDDDTGDVFPLRTTSMGGRGGKSKACASTGRRGKKAVGGGGEAEDDGEAKGGRNFWLVEQMVALIGAKGDQDAQPQGSGHAFACIWPREWKWADSRERLLKVGGPTDKCGKKWANLMQQFKKVHLFQEESGKEDFFWLSAKERLMRGFHFTMDWAVYDEIKGLTSKRHTIHPQNIADTDGAGGVQLPSGSSGGPESVGNVDVGGDGNDKDDNSTRGCPKTTGSLGDFRKRKNMR